MSFLPHPSESNETNTELGLERIVFFSDAVMAIAITLLAIDIKVPEISAALTVPQLPESLVHLAPLLASFFISFVVIGVYWNAHHRYFNYIRRYDSGLILLNMIFLLFIVLMPFVSSLLGQNNYLPLGVVVYALAVSLIGLSLAGIWFYATHRHRLVDEHLDGGVIRYRLQVALFAPLIFLFSIPFAWINPYTTMTIWWAAPLVLFVIGRLMRIIRRITLRRKPVAEEPPEDPVA